MAHLEDSFLPIHAPETSNQFWIEFQTEVDQIRNQLSNPTEFATQVYIANIKANIVKLQHCKLCFKMVEYFICFYSSFV